MMSMYDKFLSYLPLLLITLVINLNLWLKCRVNRALSLIFQHVLSKSIINDKIYVPLVSLLLSRHVHIS